MDIEHNHDPVTHDFCLLKNLGGGCTPGKQCAKERKDNNVKLSSASLHSWSNMMLEGGTSVAAIT